MLSGFARLLLVATSMAPVAIVYGASRLPSDWASFFTWLVVAALLTLICLSVLRVARKHGERETLAVVAGESKDGEVLAFLVAYVLPLIAQDQTSTNPWALIAFLLIMAVVVYRCNIYHVNPLLGMLGYHFYTTKASSGTTYLVLSKRPKPPKKGDLAVVVLSPFLALEV